MENVTIFQVLKVLEEAKVPFRLSRDRPDTIRIDVTIYGLRIEIECFDDNHVEISTFRGNEDVEGGYQYLLGILSENVSN